MLIGHETLEKNFKKLVKNKLLSHGYIFFGEQQVGKRSFAISLASYLELGSFDLPDKLLSETLLLTPDEKNIIGIDRIRELRHFFSQKPVQSDYRVAIIDDAHMLTSQAQNSILKLAEEPPVNSLIILIVPNPDILIATLQSRFQKIYFQRVREEEISKLLVNTRGISNKKADDIAGISFGRAGRAIELIEKGKKPISIQSIMQNKKQCIAELVEDSKSLLPFFTDVIAELARDPLKNSDVLKAVLQALSNISRFSTNRRIQLETALWNI